MNKITKFKRKSAPKNRWKGMATYLPKSLVEQIHLLDNSDFFEDEKELWRCIKLLGRVYKTYEDNNFQINVDLPRNYVKKIVSSDGMKMWHKLRMEENILKMVRNYGTNKKQCRSFIINPIYLLGDLVRVNYKEVRRKLTSFERKVVNILERTTLELPQSIEETVLAKEEKFRKSTTRRINMETGVYSPSKGRKFKIKGCISLFIKKEVEKKRRAEKERLASIDDGRFRASRNMTNFRLDTNYTNLNEEYKKFIRIDGKPAKFIDLCNSQFTIFSNILYSVLYEDISIYNTIDNILVNDFIYYCKMCTMSKEIEFDKEDLHKFCQACFSGQLYETLANDLGIDKSLTDKKRRAKAKIYAFHLFFSNATFSEKNELKLKLKEHYPTIVSIVDGYKKYSTFDESRDYYEDVVAYKKNNKNYSHLQVGSNNFSRVLQIVESWIFVDQLYMPMVENGDSVISIHDSFGCPYDYDIDLSNMSIYLPYGYILSLDTPNSNT